MRDFIYWLVGEATSRKVIGCWHWGQRTSVVSLSRPKAAIALLNAAIAEESLRSLKENVRRLEKMLEQQTQICTQIKSKYTQKAGEFQVQQLDDYTPEGLRAEQFLGQLRLQVERAEKFLCTVKERLDTERTALKDYQVDMKMMRDLIANDQALAAMASTNRQLQGTTASTQFTLAKGAFHKQFTRL